MKILLINPAFDYYSPHLLIKEPLSLAYLAAYLRKHGYCTAILDAAASEVKKNGAVWHYGLSKQDVIHRIKEFKPDIVGITCPFSLRIDTALEIARSAKEISKTIITVIGGIHPTIFPRETGAHPEVDYVIIGEGEKSFLALVRHIESGKSPEEIKLDGCAYKADGTIKVCSKTEFILRLDELPFPARDLLPMEFYLQNPSAVLYGLGQNRAASIITSRSCPRKCTFCSMYQSHGTKWRGRSAENVFEEIKILLKDFRVREIFFMDDNLTYDKSRIIRLCELILSGGLKFKWNTPNGIAADHLDAGLARLMKKAGCVNVCIGVESGSAFIRNHVIKKGLSEETIYRALTACKQAGLPVIGFFILGIPGENKDCFSETLKMIRKFPFSMVATSFFTPFPGTKLYDESVREAYLQADYWKNIDRFNAPIVETPDFDKKELRRREKIFYWEFLRSHFPNLILDILSGRFIFLNRRQIKRFLKEKFCIQ